MEENKNRVLAENLRKPQGEFGQKVGEMMHKGNANFYLQLPTLLALKGNEKVLEVGMGAGYHVNELTDKLENGHYVGLDYSFTMVETAREVNLGLENVSFVEADAASIPYPDGSFDAVFTINTVYFYQDPSLVFAEYYRVLRSGGKLIIGKRTVEDLQQMNAVTQYGFNLISKETIINLLQKQGFVIENTLLFNDPPRNWGDVQMNLHSEFIVAIK